MKAWGVVLGGALLLAGTAGTTAYTDRSEFCGDCHSMQRVHDTWLKSVHSHPDPSRPKADCVDCHIRWTSTGLVQAKLEGLNDVLAEYTHATAWTESPHPKFVFADECRRCHADIDKTETLARDRLPAKIRDIGLRGPHWIHFTLARFTTERAARLAELRTRGPATREEKSEKHWLELSECANCAQCHEKPGTPSQRNPLMDCVTCHVDVAHPRDSERGEAVPSFQTCRQCHNGRYHGVLGYIFPADCDRKPDVTLGEDAYCKKCHPAFQAK